MKLFKSLQNHIKFSNRFFREITMQVEHNSIHHCGLKVWNFLLNAVMLSVSIFSNAIIKSVHIFICLDDYDH